MPIVHQAVTITAVADALALDLVALTVIEATAHPTKVAVATATTATPAETSTIATVIGSVTEAVGDVIGTSVALATDAIGAEAGKRSPLHSLKTNAIGVLSSSNNWQHAFAPKS